MNRKFVDCMESSLSNHVITRKRSIIRVSDAHFHNWYGDVLGGMVHWARTGGSLYSELCLKYGWNRTHIIKLAKREKRKRQSEQ